jgi:hypothetical protein
MFAERELPWIEELRPVEPATSLWDQVEIEMARHLFNALRHNIPFPITSADALEVVRITEIVKKQNPQFRWIRREPIASTQEPASTAIKTSFSNSRKSSPAR